MPTGVAVDVTARTAAGEPRSGAGAIPAAAGLALAGASGVLLHVGAGRGAPSAIATLAGAAALAAAIRDRRPGVSAALGLLAGIVATTLSFGFVAVGVERAGRGAAAATALALAVALAHALRFGAAAAIAAGLSHGQGALRVDPRWALPAGWLAAEALDPAPLPWSLAAGVVEHPAWTAAAELGGGAIASALVVLGGSLVAELLRPSQRRRAWPAAAALAAALSLGAWRVASLETSARERPGIEVVAIHTTRRVGEPPVAAAVLRAAARDAAASGAAVVVMPEAAIEVPGLAAEEAAMLALGAPGAVTIVGASRPPRGAPARNSLVALDEAGRVAWVHDKARPFPVGEDDRFPFGLLGLSAPAGRLGPPAPRRELGALPLELDPAICWEDLFPVAPGAARPVARVAAISDAWFEGTRAAEAHLTQARLVAVTERLPTVRATNLGETVIVDALGRVASRAAQAPLALARARVPATPSGATVATSGGRALVAALAVAVTLLACARALRRSSGAS